MANSDAGPSTENPYLAHLGPKGGAGYGNGTGNGTGSNGTPASTGKNPLNGLVPRMVTTEQAKNILVSDAVSCSEEVVRVSKADVGRTVT